MNQFFLKACLIFSLVCFSQQEQENYKIVSDAFLHEYNESRYESIFDMFDDTLKTYLPLEKTNDFLKMINSNYGLIKEMELYDVNDTAHIYKTTFEIGIKEISISLSEENTINGLYIRKYIPKNLPKLERNLTKMSFPFKEEAFIYWGGETVEINYHMADVNQQYAYDILMVANGSSFDGDPTKNESYFVYGKNIISPCDAKVVKVIDGIKDNIPGMLNKEELTGNTIVLETSKKEYLLFAHLKQNSIIVKNGDYVSKGEVIAQCGNSGNTTEPHLHLQLQNVVDLFLATGAKLFFEEIIVNGEIKKDYMPVKEDFVKNKNWASE